MSFKYFLKWLYWKLIYHRVLANKIYWNLKDQKIFEDEPGELEKLLAEWRRLRKKYDGAQYDKSNYWIH